MFDLTGKTALITGATGGIGWRDRWQDQIGDRGVSARARPAGDG